MNDFEQKLQEAQSAWLATMQGYQNALGCVTFPVETLLTERHLAHCRFLPSREVILQRMNPGGIYAEVGVQTGKFSQTILNICRPTQLHLIDLDLASFKIEEKFTPEIANGQVHLHQGDSSSILQHFPDAFFDFIYIDGDHSYHGIQRDLQAAQAKLKSDGFLICNDYTFWSPCECMPYGVVQAVNELCLRDGWEMIYFALAAYMYCDVALRRL